MTTVVSARLSRRSTPRLSRCRTVFPDDAGIGHVPAKEANAALDRTRPGCDHVISTQPATTAPTTGSSHSSGAMSLTAESSAWRFVGPLGVKRADPLRQPDGLLPAGTQRGAFSAGTLDRDGADLSVSQRFTRIDPQIDRPEQCGQRVHSACPLTGPSALEPQPGPELPSATPQREVAAAARYRPLHRPGDPDSVHCIGLIDSAPLRRCHRRRFDDRQTSVGDTPGQPRTVGSETSMTTRAACSST